MIELRRRIALVCDLDGTLLGDDDALERFRRWLSANRRRTTLTYATGRTVLDVRAMVEAGEIPRPDCIVGSVGTELADFTSGAHHADWEQAPRPGWCADSARRVAAGFPELTPQPDRFQSARKVCYYFPEASQDRLAALKTALAQAGVRAKVVYSGRRYLDLLAPSMDKGSALKHLVRKSRWSSRRLIVCGDSGNDSSMYQHRFLGVLVGNADEDLRAAAKDPVYQSPLPYADGVLDGVSHWVERIDEESRRGDYSS